MAIEGLTTFQFSLIAVLILAIFFGFVLGIMWLRRKYPEHKTIDPLTKASFIILIFLIIVVLGTALLDIPSREQLKKNYPYFFIAWLVLVIVFSIWIWWGKRPIPTKKLYYEFILPTVEWMWRGREYKGNAYMTTLRMTKIIETKSHSTLSKFHRITDLAEAFYLVLKSHTRFTALIVLNKYNGLVLESHHNPSLDLLLSFMGREGIGVYIPSEFEQEPKEEQQPQQETHREIERR